MHECVLVIVTLLHHLSNKVILIANRLANRIQMRALVVLTTKKK